MIVAFFQPCFHAHPSYNDCWTVHMHAMWSLLMSHGVCPHLGVTFGPPWAFVHVSLHPSCCRLGPSGSLPVVMYKCMYTVHAVTHCASCTLSKRDEGLHVGHTVMLDGMQKCSVDGSSGGQMWGPAGPVRARHLGCLCGKSYLGFQ